MFVLVFAQGVTAAHVCSILAPAPQGLAQAGTPDAQVMPADCPAMAKESEGATANVCSSHCVFGQQVDARADAPTAAIAPQVSLKIRLVGPSGAANAENALLAAPGAVVPRLLFSRFLI